MKNKILIVSHSGCETITRSAQSIRKLRKAAEIVTLQDLMGDFEIFDELSDQGGIVRWYRENRCFSSLNHLLLNRVSHIPDSMFDPFAEYDREYARREFEAYLSFAFGVFSGTDNRFMNGLCGDGQSLPGQWKIVSELDDIDVPDYYWGPHFMNSISDDIPCVYSNIYNFLNWSLSDTENTDGHVFCFKKPKGFPIFVLTMGDRQLVTCDVLLSHHDRDIILSVSRQISRLFGYFISEMLLFMDGEKMVFGCINPEVIRSPRNGHFNDFLSQHLISEFYRCAV